MLLTSSAHASMQQIFSCSFSTCTISQVSFLKDIKSSCDVLQYHFKTDSAKKSQTDVQYHRKHVGHFAAKLYTFKWLIPPQRFGVSHISSMGRASALWCVRAGFDF